MGSDVEILLIRIKLRGVQYHFATRKVKNVAITPNLLYLKSINECANGKVIRGKRTNRQDLYYNNINYMPQRFCKTNPGAYWYFSCRSLSESQAER